MTPNETSRFSPLVKTNLVLAFSVLAFEGVLLFALPLALLPASPLWLLLLLPSLWVSALHWGLIHEAIHRNFHPDKRINEMAGRILSISLGTTFSLLRFGHLMHHQMNRKWQSEIVAEVNWKTRLHYYWTLFAGVYFTELMASFLIAISPDRHTPELARRYFFAHIPEVADIGNRYFFTRGNVKPLRMDMVAVFLLYGMVIAAYGAQWPVLLAVIAVRAFAISFMDNLYHYGTPSDNSEVAKNLGLPVWAERAMLNGNYHETHHLQPLVPWHQLPQHAARSAQYRFIDGAALQFHGPISKQEKSAKHLFGLASSQMRMQ